MTSSIKMQSFVKNHMDGEIQIISLKLIKQDTGISSDQKMETKETPHYKSWHVPQMF